MKMLFVLFMTYSIASAQTVSDSLLRSELLKRVQVDQDVRRVHFTEKSQRGVQPDSADFRALTQVDSNNTAWIRKVIRQRGWLGIRIVGADGEEAAFLLVQHADRDTAFQAECLQLLRTAFDQGQTTGQHLALLTDRVEVAAGRPQVYGSQAIIKADRVIFRPIRDSISVDQRRSRLGLMPLNEYKRLLDSMYTTKGKAK